MSRTIQRKSISAQPKTDAAPALLPRRFGQKDIRNAADAFFKRRNITEPSFNGKPRRR